MFFGLIVRVGVNLTSLYPEGREIRLPDEVDGCYIYYMNLTFRCMKGSLGRIK